MARDDSWIGPCCWTKEMRAVQAFAEAFRPEVLSNDPWERTEQLMVWQNVPDWRTARREAYVAAWPLEAQAEAQSDALMGDMTKLDRMREDFDAIRARFPKPAEVVVIGGVEWPLEIVEEDGDAG